MPTAGSAALLPHYLPTQSYLGPQCKVRSLCKVRRMEAVKSPMGESCVVGAAMEKAPFQGSTRWDSTLATATLGDCPKS